MNLKVLWVTSEFPKHKKSNRNLYLWHSLEALQHANVEVIVLYTPAWKPFYRKLFLHKEFPINIKTSRHFSFPRHYFRRISNFLYITQIVSKIKKLNIAHQFDIIHAHGEIAGLAATKAAHEIGIASVVTIHGIDMSPRMLKGYKKKLFHPVFNLANKIIYVGEPLKKYFLEKIDKNVKCSIVENGFRLPDNQCVARYNEGCIRIISVSNLHEGKGIDLMLRVLAQLKNQGIINWLYTIIGSGDQKPYLAQLVHQFDLGKQVIFLGDCSHDKVYENLALSDVFCLPSYREAFGIAYIEAMAHGLLTMGVKGQGPQAYIEHGKTGFLVEPKSINSLYNALNTVINNFEAMCKIAENGKQHVLANYTWKKHAKNLIDVYKEVCQ